MYYFAYGTLLDIDVMKKVAPSVRSHGIMRLDGYRMDFGKCADGKNTGCTLVRDENTATYGVQYEMSDEEMAGMDKHAVSGQSLWVYKPVNLINLQGDTIESNTYTIPGELVPIAPTDEYVRPILKGLDDVDFKPAYIAKMKELIDTTQKRP